MKPMDKLLKCIPTLEPIEFIGLARLLGVKLIDTPADGEPVARDFTDVLADVLAKFDQANRASKRQVLQLVDKRKRSAAGPSGTARSEAPQEDINAGNS